ncbi:MAG: M23 family metallopeptidase, partial [Gammaproteobacteria bacterium]
MEIVINTDTRGRYSFQADPWLLAVIFSVMCLFVITLCIMGFLLNRNEIIALGVDSGIIDAWQKRVQHQEQQITHIRQQANTQLEVLAQRAAELQADIHRLEGLSQRLAESANIDIQRLTDEFRMTSPFLVTYNELGENVTPVTPTDFMQTLDNLGYQLASRAEQLLLLEKLILRQDLNEDILGITRIVDRGWITSSYGYRTDPFTQNTTLHNGIDISGQPGSQVKAIAAGMIRFSGPRAGFGNLVEIDHGNGFVTRYGHNRANLVVVGDI